MTVTADQVIASMLRRYPDQPVHGYQAQAIELWMRQDLRIAAWSCARGGAKTALAARYVAELVSGPLAEAGTEIALVAPSHYQAGHLYGDLTRRYLARAIAAGGAGQRPARYRLVDNQSMRYLEDRRTGVSVRVVGSTSSYAHGQRARLTVCDEPAQWQRSGGRRLWAALTSGLGKVAGSRILVIGTRPEHGSHWYAQLLDDPRPEEGVASIVHQASADADPLDWSAVQAANPGLRWGLPDPAVLRQELNAARRDPSALQTWRALRLNQGVPDTLDGDLMVSAEEWAQSWADPLPEPAGSTVWGLDLGGRRSLSAVACYWPATGLLLVRAAVGSVPSLADRGHADGAADIYARAQARGDLLVAGGRLADVGRLLESCAEEWGVPSVLVADQYRRAEVEDLLDRGPPDLEVVWRGRRSADGAGDLATYRQALYRGRVRTDPDAELLTWSHSVARTRRNPGGLDYIVSGAGERRDDLAVASVLAVAEGLRRRSAQERRPAGATMRVPSPVQPW